MFHLLQGDIFPKIRKEIKNNLKKADSEVAKYHNIDLLARIDKGESGLIRWNNTKTNDRRYNLQYFL